ncbi:MAG TPA: class I SAM-dependent methyltransferase, partial [Saprospiraceae bacterium]|nr:class I SAM-dependent methyltransferase [Saprospiraceae bacterium]
MQSLSKEVKQAYENQYDASIVAWREVNGRHKAENIVRVLSKHRISPLRVCEVGCGEGSILKALGQTGVGEELYGLDISTSAIDIAKGKDIARLVEIKPFDGYHIPYPDASFDLVVCSHVIEHVEHPRLLLREIKRISKMQYFEVPIDFSLQVDRKLEHYLGYGHINVYTPSLFRFLLKSEKFEIVDEVHVFISDDIL